MVDPENQYGFPKSIRPESLPPTDALCLSSSATHWDLFTGSDVSGRVPAMVPPVRSEVLPVTPIPLSIMHNNRAHLNRCVDERTASHIIIENGRKKREGY